MTDTCVYIHTRSDDVVFYVGIGNEKRPYSASSRNKHWNRIVSKYGYFVTILHAGLTWEEACAKEIELIANYRQISGSKLCNKTLGGDGAKGAIRSEETLAKMRASMQGKVISAEQRVKLSAAMKGHKNNLGKKYSPEHRAKISAANKNPSPETREKLAAASRGKHYGLGYKHTDEARARMSELAKKRPPRSEEVREKIRVSMLARHRAAKKEYFS